MCVCPLPSPCSNKQSGLINVQIIVATRIRSMWWAWLIVPQWAGCVRPPCGNRKDKDSSVCDPLMDSVYNLFERQAVRQRGAGHLRIPSVCGWTEYSHECDRGDLLRYPQYANVLFISCVHSVGCDTINQISHSNPGPDLSIFKRTHWSTCLLLLSFSLIPRGEPDHMYKRVINLTQARGRDQQMDIRLPLHAIGQHDDQLEQWTKWCYQSDGMEIVGEWNVLETVCFLK